ncbi:MAG: hypothetical protein ABW000_06315 [Actinoplanes sp.]
MKPGLRLVVVEEDEDDDRCDLLDDRGLERVMAVLTGEAEGPTPERDRADQQAEPTRWPGASEWPRG